MNYLKLSPKKLVELAKYLKQQYYLIIPERPTLIALDENKYSHGWSAWKKTYIFSVIEKDGEKKLITVQNGDGTILYAVTKQQYKSWKSWKIVSELKGWNVDRVINCISQLSYQYDLISPAQDLDTLHRFFKKILYRRK